MLLVIMKQEVDGRGIRQLKIWQRYLGRFLLMALLVVLQAIICVSGPVSYTHLKDHARAFNVFGGTVGKCIVAGVGLLLTVFALVVSFFPPSQLDAQSGMVYVATLIICWVVSVAIPFVVYALRKHWNGGIDHDPPTIPSKKMLATAAATSSSAPAPAKDEPAQKQAASVDAHSSDSPPKGQS